MLNSVKTLYSRQSDDLKGLVKGVFWSLFGSVLSKALVFLSWILVARILGRESYGEYGLIRNTVLMFSAFRRFRTQCHGYQVRGPLYKLKMSPSRGG